MKIILFQLFIVALLAVVVALFAWAVAKIQNAVKARPGAKRQRIGNANRSFFRRHFRKVHLAPLLVERVAWWFGFTRAPRGGIQFANIGEGTFEHGRKSYLIDVATASRYLMYKIGSDGDHAAVCGAGEIPLGTSDDVATDVTIPITINLLGVCHGLLRVTTDGSIANGDHVKCAAAGQVTKANSTDRSFGIAIIGTDTSSAAGDVITIQHCVPQLYVF